ncbi:ABC-type molybdate transport system substrate-binding protein [Thermocatellispora tengchongensis]|uniref:ABC-type molybdate transport system substrate-binding protein n=1 Tax=Thermocatellispora tengchongensis TaxID=1073253 RepID=A0A840PKE4_9ACTN|nr:substrate-binding and VWA domain-containing protein [Thermocatellispora tengchongensis]MBB5136525.1 ABC-type molybdate transport system substrate-binding protein [Thermocatellispora tengchongensis]
MFVPLAGAVALAVLLGVAAFVIVNRDRGCAGDELALRVTASPDIQPALSAVAATFNGARHSVDGRCVQVSVKKADASSVAGALGGTGVTSAEGAEAGKGGTDVWVPDSSLWLSQLQAKGVELPRPTASAAHSPIVLVASRTVVASLKQSFGAASWTGLVSAANVANPDGLARKVRVLAPDPARNASGMGALIAASGVLRESGQQAQLIGALKQLSQSLARSPDALLASLDVKSGRAPIGVSSEQAVWAYNTTKKPTNPAVPLYPAEGTLNLDYPVVVLAKDAAVTKAAAEFTRQLSTEAAKTAIRKEGFRTADDKAGPALAPASGFAAKPPKALALPDAKTVASLSQSWSRLNLGTRLLALYDVSGTMALPVPGTGQDRMSVIARIAGEGLKLFPPDSEIGAWEFSTHLAPNGADYREMVPVGPITETINGKLRKDLLVQHLATIKAKPTGDTGLNDTLAAAYERMTEEYQPDKINTLLVLTDGAGNDDPDGGLSNAEILRRLRAQYDETKPVSILIIAFGPDAPKGKRTMEALAKATGGELFIAKNILDVRKFFLQGMERRLCSPHCDG